MNVALRAIAVWLAAAVWCGVALAQAAATQLLRVGSKIDTEGKLLGHMMVLVLEANGIKTQSKVSLGNTQVMRGAIMAGEIDVYPEYTGNGAFIFAEEKSPVWKNLQTGYERVKALDYACQQ